MSSKVDNVRAFKKKVVSCAIEDNMVLVEASEKNSDTVPMIKGRYSVYIYYGKLVMHVPSYFGLPGNT